MKFFSPDVPELFRVTEQGLSFHPKIGDLLADPTYWTTPEARRHAAIAAALWQGETYKAQADAYRSSLIQLYQIAGVKDLPDQFDPTTEANRISAAMLTGAAKAMKKAQAKAEAAKKPAKASKPVLVTPRTPRAKKTQPEPAVQAAATTAPSTETRQ